MTIAATIIERGYPAKPDTHSLPRPAFLDSSFRWNDNGVMSSFMGGIH